MCMCHKLHASRSCRQTRKDKGFRLDAQALCHINPDCLPPYVKLVNSIEASLEPSAASP